MQLKKALDLSFLGFMAKEQVPVRKYPVRVLLPCKGPRTRWIRIWYHRARKNSPGRLNVRHEFKASRRVSACLAQLGSYVFLEEVVEERPQRRRRLGLAQFEAAKPIDLVAAQAKAAVFGRHLGVELR